MKYISREEIMFTFLTQLLAYIIIPTAVCLCLRFLYLASKNGKLTPPSRYLKEKRTKPCSLIVVMGSGGHTAEMLRLMGGMNLEHYYWRVYVVAEGDKMSVEKATRFESSLSATKPESSTSTRTEAIIKEIPRARQVMQSYFTSVFSTLRAIFASFSIVFQTFPDLVLCNGPGTCIPICFWAYLMNFFGLKATKIVYVESLCRVEHLSLSGMMLYYLYVADHLFVQWPQLVKKYPRTHYIGRIV